VPPPEFEKGVKHPEADEATALSDSVCGAEQPRRFTVTACADGECGEALESFWSGAVPPGAGGGCERVVRVTAGLLGLTLHDRNAGARRRRQRQLKATRRRDDVIGQAPGRGQIPARQGGLSRVSTRDRRQFGLETEMRQGRRDRIVRRGEVATVNPT
jgi:hypothetical protein